MAEVCHDYFYWLQSVKIYFTGYSINALDICPTFRHDDVIPGGGRQVLFFTTVDTFGHNLSFLVQSATLSMAWLHAATISVIIVRQKYLSWLQFATLFLYCLQGLTVKGERDSLTRFSNSGLFIRHLLRGHCFIP